MKRNIIFVISVWVATLVACTSPATIAYKSSSSISIECIQLTGSGDCIVTVQGTGHNYESATESAMKGAVFQLLFIGIKGNIDNRIQPISPLVKDNNIPSDNSEYFNTFFRDETYKTYTEIIPGSVPSVVKAQKGYRVTLTLILKKEALRKRLEKDNIIKSLSNII